MWNVSISTLNERYNRPYLLQVYLFKRTVYRTKNFNELHFVYDQQTEYLEFFQSARRSFPHILFIFRKLGLIDEEGVLNVEREFTTLHIREILKNDEGRNYRSYGSTEVNHLIRAGSPYRYTKRSAQMTCNTLRSMINFLTKSFFKYEIDREEDRRSANGERFSTYTLKPLKDAPGGDIRPRCLFTFLKNDWPDTLS